MRSRKRNKRERRNLTRYREYQLRANLEENGYRYQPNSSSISYAEFIVHQFLQCYYGETQLVGVQALKEVIMFLKTYESIFISGYCPRTIYYLALKVALRKVWGQRFIDLNEKPSIIKNTDNVEQAIREALRASNITTEVDTFIMQYV